MKQKKIRVLMIAPGKEPDIVTLDNNLDALQKAVSIDAPSQGLIEIITLDKKNCILCNEEGKLIGLEPNRRLGYDILCGVFYICGQSKDGELRSLSEERIRFWSHVFAEPEYFEADEVEKALSTGFTIL